MSEERIRDALLNTGAEPVDAEDTIERFRERAREGIGAYRFMDPSLDRYQEEAASTGRVWDELPFNEHSMLLGLGLCGEAGEAAEVIKKVVGHGAAPDRDKLIEELGDTLWYLSEQARHHGVPLSDVAAANIAKIRRRYPDGFVLGGGVR